jgi:hypothetical protein
VSPGLLSGADGPLYVSTYIHTYVYVIHRMRLEDSKTHGNPPILLPDVTPLDLYTLIQGRESSSPAEFGANQAEILKCQLNSDFI